MIGAVSESEQTGASPGPGTFSCVRCGSQVSLEHLAPLPDCPRCGASRFLRSSIFDPPSDFGERGAETADFPAEIPAAPTPDWLERARERLPRGGRYLVLSDDEIRVYELEQGWNRIGRSSSADIRLDDPSVSRRHALIVWEPGEELRVLDDRSLNGIRLNGAPVDWGTVSDGDEVLIGRYRLFLLEA